jgi:hypothetical protein
VIASSTRRDRRRRRRRPFALAWLVRIVVVLAAFGIGVAVGQALHDNPKPGGTVTYVRTLPPGSLTQP